MRYFSNTNITGAPTVFVIVGDSHSRQSLNQGMGSSPASPLQSLDGYLEVVVKRLYGGTWFNEARGGESVSNFLGNSGWQQDILSYNPDVVFFFLGGIDILNEDTGVLLGTSQIDALFPNSQVVYNVPVLPPASYTQQQIDSQTAILTGLRYYLDNTGKSYFDFGRAHSIVKGSDPVDIYHKLSVETFTAITLDNASPWAPTIETSVPSYSVQFTLTNTQALTGTGKLIFKFGASQVDTISISKTQVKAGWATHNFTTPLTGTKEIGVSLENGEVLISIDKTTVFRTNWFVPEKPWKYTPQISLVGASSHTMDSIRYWPGVYRTITPILTDSEIWVDSFHYSAQGWLNIHKPVIDMAL